MPSTIKWDDTNDRRLLLAMILTSDRKFDWKNIASQFGDDVSANAVTKRWRKILKDHEEGVGQKGSGKDEVKGEDEQPRKRQKRVMVDEE